MKKTLSALVLAAFALSLTPATAQPFDLSSKHTEMLLRKLLAEKPAGQQKTLVAARTAAVRVQGTIQKVSSFPGPLFCTVDFDYFDSVSQTFRDESKTNEVKFTGNNGVCDVRVPFRWENIDDSGEIEVGVSISNEISGSNAASKASAKTVRGSRIGFEDVPLPAEGTTANFTFDIRM